MENRWVADDNPIAHTFATTDTSVCFDVIPKGCWTTTDRDQLCVCDNLLMHS